MPAVRWIFTDSAVDCPPLLRFGVRPGRCHDVALTEALLLGHEGRPVPPAARPPSATPQAQASLFDTSPDGGPEGSPNRGPDGGTAEARLETLVARHADQLARIAHARRETPGFGLLVAAESAAGLAAAEMGFDGLPWNCDVHDALLEEALGPRPPFSAGPARPPKLQALAEEVTRALDDPTLNPDSQPEVLRALRRAGLPVRSTRRSELARHEHPALGPLRRYKELARLHAANGWAWQEQWIRNGRFHPEYVPGGVVSGRWATRGGGALQIPKPVRAAVTAGPGQVLVVADAGQLEPRVLAALSGDPGMTAATAEGDLYSALAVQALGRADRRPEMKIALLSAMYGGGAGSPALAALRRRFPAALALLEDAARTGEDGGSVRSVLGRTAPAAAAGWLDGLPDDAAGARARARGRFTRNFVIQASAADWAGVLLAGLRTRLAELRGDGMARLVFFQHDEVVVEADEHLAGAVVDAVADAGREATRLTLPGTGVRVPLDAAVVRSYAETA